MTANKVGRPLKFQSLTDLEEAINKFFTDCDVNKEPYTITGLALALDTTRQSLCDYEKREEFTDTLKKAKARVENYAEKRLFEGQPTGAIFALKNYGWSDKQDINLGGQEDNPVQTKVTVEFIKPNANT